MDVAPLGTGYSGLLPETGGRHDSFYCIVVHNC